MKDTAVWFAADASTGREPTDDTGRMGVPPWEPLGEIMILRLSPREASPVDAIVRIATVPDVEDLCHQYP